MRIEKGSLKETPPASSTLMWMILGVALLLRLSGLTGFSLSNDELSALARLQFDSAGEVITNGVYPDFHPAGVQLFLYYWTLIFGFSEWAVRLPFALMGAGAVYLIYRLGSYWFGVPAGLFAAAALAVLEFPLLYSQIARPYSPGLFFSLLMAFYWTKALFENDQPGNNKGFRWWNFISFALSVSACMYIHYFSFILAGIFCFAGLFFLKRNSWVPYLVAGVIIILLYVPHFNLLLHQLSKGGVGGADGWLGPPGKDAFGKYLDYCFNDSYQLKLLYFIIASGIIFLFRKEIKLNPFHLLALLFFALPFAIAYYYSLWKNPVFQHSVLLFSFPYLLLLLFSFIPPNAGQFTIRILLFAILAGGFYSTVYEKKYYETTHFSEFRGIASRVKALDEKFGARQITKTISVFSPYYINYYLDKLSHTTEFKLTSVMTDDERREFRKAVEESKTPYYLHAYSNVYDDPRLDLVIRSKYPWLLLRDSMLNSGLRFYSKERSDSALNRLPALTIKNSFENGDWNNEIAFRDSSIKYDGKYSTHLTPVDEYGPGLMKPLKDLGIVPGASVEISVVVYSKSVLKDAKLVLSVERKNEVLYWVACNASDFAGSPGSWSRLFLSATIPVELEGNEELKIYCWNEKQEELWLDDFILNIYSPR